MTLACYVLKNLLYIRCIKGGLEINDENIIVNVFLKKHIGHTAEHPPPRPHLPSNPTFLLKND